MKKHHFSIIEVITSLAILTMGVTALLTLQSQAIARSATQNERLKEHLLFTQAVEYFLLAGPDKIMTEDIFNESDYTATCTVLDLQQQQPEENIDMNTTLSTAKVVTLRIELFYQGKALKSLDYNMVLSLSE